MEFYLGYFINAPANIIGNSSLREPQEAAYRAIYNHFIIENNSEHALVTLPTGERVIIVTGCINVLESRVSGTSINNNSCIY